MIGRKNVLAIILLIAGGFSEFLSTTYEGLLFLYGLGFKTIFAAIDLGSEMRIYVSLYLTFSLLILALLFLSALIFYWNLPSQAGSLAIASGILEIISIFLPRSFNATMSSTRIFTAILTLILAFASGSIGLFAGRGLPWRAPFLSTLEITTSAALSALTGVFTALTGSFVPSPTGGYTHIGDTIIFVSALLFGCKVGGLTGIVGSVAADFYLGYPRWYVSIPAHGIEGFIAGVARGKHLSLQIAFCALGGFLMATTYFYVNIFIKGYPVAVISYMRDLFGQAGISIVLGIIVTRFVQKAFPKLKR